MHTHPYEYIHATLSLWASPRDWAWRSIIEFDKVTACALLSTVILSTTKTITMIKSWHKLIKNASTYAELKTESRVGRFHHKVGPNLYLYLCNTIRGSIPWPFAAPRHPKNERPSDRRSNGDRNRLSLSLWDSLFSFRLDRSGECRLDLRLQQRRTAMSWAALFLLCSTYRRHSIVSSFGFRNLSNFLQISIPLYCHYLQLARPMSLAYFFGVLLVAVGESNFLIMRKLHGSMQIEQSSLDLGSQSSTPVDPRPVHCPAQGMRSCKPKLGVIYKSERMN